MGRGKREGDMMSLDGQVGKRTEIESNDRGTLIEGAIVELARNLV